VTAIYAIDPLRDPRWAEMVERHARASVFHTPGWLEALRRTYGYEPVVYTTSPPRADLTDGVVLCRVRSRITAEKIRVASKDGWPIASILTLSWKDVMVYKYGCSDERFHSLGGMHLPFWTVIQEAKVDGCRDFDFGRSGCDNLGLITFKDHWGASRSELAYLRLT
jgi:Acetyltransferase (GNAT) domain